MKIEYKGLSDTKEDFSLSFYFNVNPYLENTVVVKSFKFDQDGFCKISDCSPLIWKFANHDISNKGIRNIKDKDQDGTFFRFFTTIKGTKDKENPNDIAVILCYSIVNLFI